jgi:hypothetical protein
MMKFTLRADSVKVVELVAALMSYNARCHTSALHFAVSGSLGSKPYRHNQMKPLALLFQGILARQCRD